jgi:predicted enzyme related to lactoylglutathione lyase
MPENNHVDLIELPARPDDLAVTRTFYESAFGWAFTDYGAYVDTAGSGTVLAVNAVADEHQQQMPLTVLYVTDLEAARTAVTDAGGTIRHDIYAFPGGRRFHFTDPAGNELAAWSE